MNQRYSPVALDVRIANLFSLGQNALPEIELSFITRIYHSSTERNSTIELRGEALALQQLFVQVHINGGNNGKLRSNSTRLLSYSRRTLPLA